MARKPAHRRPTVLGVGPEHPMFGMTADVLPHDPAYRNGSPRLTQHFLAITAAIVEVGPREPFRLRALS